MNHDTIHNQTQHALAGIAAAIRAGDGYAVLSGDPGSGKSAAARELFRQLRGECSTALIADATLDPVMMLRSILTGFGVKPNDGDISVLTHQLNHVLVERYNQDIRCVAMFDDAHTFSPEMIHWLCELGYHRASNTKLLQIVLIGRNELLHTLRHARIEPFCQRTSNWYRPASAPQPQVQPQPQPTPQPAATVEPPQSAPVLKAQWQRVAAAVTIAVVALGAASFGLIGGRTQLMYGQDAPGAPSQEPSAPAPQPQVREPQPAPSVEPMQSEPRQQAQDKPQSQSSSQMAMLPSIELPAPQPAQVEQQPEQAAAPQSEPAEASDQEESTISVSRREASEEQTRQAAAPRRTKPRATVDDAWSLYNSRTEPDDPSQPRSTITPSVTPGELSESSTPRGESPAVWVGAFATQEDAQVAARSAMFHLQRNGGAEHVGGYVAVQEASDPEQRHVTLLGGFKNRDDATATVDSLDRFGYDSRVMRVDFGAAQSDQSHD